MRRREKKLGEPREVVLERLLAEGNAGQAQEVVLEVVQVPGNRLAIEAGARIADLVVQIAASLDLEARQNGDDLAVCFDRLRRNVVARCGGVPRKSNSVVSPRSSSR